jgi:hypothetical protein
MRIARKFIPFLTLFLSSFSLYAQDSRAALADRLASVYTLTHPNGDETDILSAGVVLTLKKDKLTMVPITDLELAPNIYKDGKLTQNVMGHLPGVRKRIFVATEKMWVTQIQVKNDGVYFDLLSDPIEEVRYKGVLRFPFPKGTVPLFEEANKSIAEVFDSEPLPGAKPARPVKSSARSSQADAPPPPIPPPPPPPQDAPPAAQKTISLGQTPDQVVAILGQPQKIIKPTNTKQIYIYPDMKVIFVANKVSDVQ